MKKIVSFVMVLCMLFCCSVNAFAADDEYIIELPNTSARSYDSTFTLDFTTSAGWTLNFDNNALAVWNHKYVTVDYDSCSPHSTTAKVKIVLYIDDNEDGNYEMFDPDGGYTYQLEVGDYIKIELPYENTVKNYRLLLENQTSSITSGTFTVTTSRN